MIECFDTVYDQGDTNDDIDSIEEKQTPEDVKRNFSSLPTIPIDLSEFVRTIVSDPTVFRGQNYDILCGPWYFPKTPAFKLYDIPLVPQICTWLFIPASDMPFMKENRYNKEAILSLVENKLPDNILFGDPVKDVFLQLMWEVFRFARDRDYTERAVSSLMGLFYLTHRFFLTTAWRTAAETFEFFKEGVLLHSVLDNAMKIVEGTIPDTVFPTILFIVLPHFQHPPKSAEVFTPTESKMSLDLFRSMYMRHLVLLRFACIPNYQLVLILEQDLPQEEVEEPPPPPPPPEKVKKKKK